jgi:AcrR family transcriptional regulator
MSVTSRGRPRSIEDAQILSAAREALQTLGHGVSVREIARLADVSEGTIYRRFPSKEALVAAACGYDLWVLVEPFRTLESQVDLDLVAGLTRLVDGFRRIREACAPHSAARASRRSSAATDVEELVRLECTRALARFLGRFVATEEEAVDWALAFVAVLWLEDPREAARAVRPLLAVVGERQKSPRVVGGIPSTGTGSRDSPALCDRGTVCSS